MLNYIVAGIVILLVILAVRYIYKEKKNGSKCIGCSSAGCCSRKNCKK